MLSVQKFLLDGGSLEDLNVLFNINTYEHPTLPLVGFKYGIIQSDDIKFHPITRECQGLVLEKAYWKVVAYPFNRFFNLGEDAATEDSFKWNNFICEEKCDGSLIILYHYNNQWMVNTSGSFGQGLVGNSGLTWEKLFWKVSGINKDSLIKNCTYIFELCTKYNKIVRTYEEPLVYLIGLRNNTNNNECSHQCVIYESFIIGTKRPKRYNVCTQEDIYNQLKKESEKDPSFEGFVLTDRNFNRIKIKSDSYKQLHWLKGNNNFSIEKMVYQILDGNISYLEQNFVEWNDEIQLIVEMIDGVKINTENVLWETQNKASRKEFAEYVLDTAIIPSYLFMIKDGKYRNIDDAFINNPKPLINYLEKNWKTLS